VKVETIIIIIIILFYDLKCEKPVVHHDSNQPSSDAVI